MAVMSAGTWRPRCSTRTNVVRVESEDDEYAECKCARKELNVNAVQRAREIVLANEWKGDIRQNMTTIIGAGRVLAKRIDELESAFDLLLSVSLAPVDVSGKRMWDSACRIRFERNLPGAERTDDE